MSRLNALHIGLALVLSILVSAMFNHSVQAQDDNSCQLVLNALADGIERDTCQQIEQDNACYASDNLEATLRVPDLTFGTRNERVKIVDIRSLISRGPTGAAIMYVETAEDPVKIIVFGDANVSPSGGQAYTMHKTGGRLLCERTPSGMLVQTKTGETGQVVVNGVTIRLHSTAFITMDGVVLFDQDPRVRRRFGERNPNADLCSGFDSECNFANCAINTRLVWGPFCREDRDTYIEPGLYRVTLYGGGTVEAGATDFNATNNLFAYGRQVLTLPDQYTFCYPGLQPGGTGFETLVRSLTPDARVDRITLEYLGGDCNNPWTEPDGDTSLMTVTNVEGSVEVSIPGQTVILQEGEWVTIVLVNNQPVAINPPNQGLAVLGSRAILWLTDDERGLAWINENRPPGGTDPRTTPGSPGGVPNSTVTSANPPLVPTSTSFTGASALFIENVGQFDENLRFVTFGGEKTVAFLDDSMWVSFATPSLRDAHFRISFVNANPTPQIEPFGPIDSAVSFFSGGDPSKWQRGVPVWRGVRYVDLYPNIDLEVFDDYGHVSQRLIARPGANLNDVIMNIDGAKNISVRDGYLDLVIQLEEYYQYKAETINYSIPLLSARTSGGDVLGSDVTPRLDGAQIIAPVAKTADGTAENNTLSGQVIRQEQFIDSRIFTRLFGNYNHDLNDSVTVDKAGDAYVYGSVQLSGYFPSLFALAQDFSVDLNQGRISEALRRQLALYGHTLKPDMIVTDKEIGRWWKIENKERQVWIERLNGKTFVSAGNPKGYGNLVAKIDGDNGDLIYAAFLDGVGSSFSEITVDDNGHAYITGSGTDNAPTTPGAYDTTHYQSGDAIVIKLDSDGKDIVYGTFLGNGENDDKGQGIAVDAEGYVYITGLGVTGYTSSPGSYSYGSGIFVIKLNQDGSDIIYHATVGGGYAADIAVDQPGNVYVTGFTLKDSVPVTPLAYDTIYSSPGNTSEDQGDAFVFKLSADGSTLLYSTYLGGNNPMGDGGAAIGVDQFGNAYVAGDTTAGDFPVTDGAYVSSPPGQAGFITKINPDGSDLIYSAMIGPGVIRDLALDEEGRVYVAGMTHSEAFPTTDNAFDRTYGGNGGDAFVSVLNPDGSTLLYSTYVGGSSTSNFTDDGNDTGYGIGLGHCGDVFVSGYTGTFYFPGADVLNSRQGGRFDAYVTKLPTRNDDTCQADLGSALLSESTASADRVEQPTSANPTKTPEPLRGPSVLDTTDEQLLAAMYGTDPTYTDRSITVVHKESYVQDGVDKLFVVTQITPQGDFSCRLCYPDVGAAVFAKVEDGWQLEAVSLNMGIFGMWGEIYSGTLTEIGDGNYGMLFSTYFGGGPMGFLSEGQALMYPVGSTVEFVFNGTTSMSGLEFCDQPGVECYSWTAEIAFVPGPNTQFNDIRLRSTGTRPAESGEGLESADEEKLYRFDGKAYLPVADALPAPVGNDPIVLNGDFVNVVQLLMAAAAQRDRPVLETLFSGRLIWAAPYGIEPGDLTVARSQQALGALLNAITADEMTCDGYRLDGNTSVILVSGLQIDWTDVFGWETQEAATAKILLNFALVDDVWQFFGYSPIPDLLLDSFQDSTDCSVVGSSSPSEAGTAQSAATEVGQTPTPANLPTSTRTSAPAAAVTPAPVQLRIITNDLNVREGPGTTYERIGQLDSGQRVTVIGRNPDDSWWNVCCVDGRAGWVINDPDYVSIEGDALDVQPSQAPTLAPAEVPAPVPPATVTPAALGNNCSVGTDALFNSLWQRYRALIGCPRAGRTTIETIAEESFQGGHMFWRKDTDEVYVIYDRDKGSGSNLSEGQWTTNPLWKWDGSDPEGISLAPPSGLVEPLRGFGWVWRKYLGRENGQLGWALDREYGFDGVAQAQIFEQGIMFKGSDAKVYLLLNNRQFFAQ